MKNEEEYTREYSSYMYRCFFFKMTRKKGLRFCVHFIKLSIIKPETSKTSNQNTSKRNTIVIPVKPVPGLYEVYQHFNSKNQFHPTLLLVHTLPTEQ